MTVSLDITVITTVCSCVAGVAGVIAIFNKYFKSKLNVFEKKIKEDTKAEIADGVCKELQEQTVSSLNEIKENINKIFGHMDGLEKADEDAKKIVTSFRICTLKGLIVQAHGTYMPAGKISNHVLASLEEIFDNYTAMGGNHFIKDLMEDLRNLPRNDD